MKTKILKFSLATFIKSVQSTIRKVGEFALNNIEYVLVVMGIAAKTYETLIAGFDMPLSFYTDIALDILLVWGWMKYRMADCIILRRRQVTCALNLLFGHQMQLNLQVPNMCGYILRKLYQQHL